MIRLATLAFALPPFTAGAAEAVRGEFWPGANGWGVILTNVSDHGHLLACGVQRRHL
jgi:hypothetical protein